MKEQEVLEITCEWLKSNGYKIISTAPGNVRGVDVVAELEPGLELRVECKGSSSPTTGRDFSRNESWRRVSGALFDVVRCIETKNDKSALFAMALPASPNYNLFLAGLREFCIRNGIIVLWIEQSEVTEVWQSEPKKPLKTDAPKRRAF